MDKRAVQMNRLKECVRKYNIMKRKCMTYGSRGFWLD